VGKCVVGVLAELVQAFDDLSYLLRMGGREGARERGREGGRDG